GRFGYLLSLLDALGIPLESQLLLFSKTSLQAVLIDPANPRALFFNDDVAVGWIRSSPTLEVAAHDPDKGMIFYTIDQSRQTRPVLTRERDVCVGCHSTDSSLGVPGLIVRSVFPKDTGAIATGLIGSEADHRVPFAERWGGWYVTGKRGPLYHRGNAVVDSVRETGGGLASTQTPSVPLQEKFATKSFPTPYSDVVALTIFEHQAHMLNQITRMGQDARLALHRASAQGIRFDEKLLSKQVTEFVDYLLFIQEAQFTGEIEGTSGFAEKFSSLGPFDSKGRSLRQFDLRNRLMRYPCSYMIYSEAFRSLPVEARYAIYKRMWRVLSGEEHDKKYNRLALSDRKAIVEILLETVEDLPDYFKPL
ncbi:MAG TPA: hypothetical protein VFE29_04850, partial [Terriglobia bacterium]|nr:hypothetical protein [Terriglobia bacterium]